MKFRVQHTRILTFQEEIEANSLVEAQGIARQRNKELTNAEYSDAVSTCEVMPLGRLSLIDENGPHPKLLLDGIPITDGQILLTKRGEGEPTPGRASLHSDGKWYLHREEFIGHTYLNTPLSAKWLENLIVTTVEDPTTQEKE